MNEIRVLVIDDQEAHAQAVAESLARIGYDCDVASSGVEGIAKIEKENYDVIITDVKMEPIDGLTVLRKAKVELPEAEVVLITGHGDIRTAVTAIQQGAATYLTKPVDINELRAVVERVAQKQRLARTNLELQRRLDEKFGFEGIVGNSPAIHAVIEKLKQIAPTNATVLITGETGTGKELVAKAIHNNSPRKSKPFVPLNCTALNENLLEDELFGHEPGAFTGADRLRKGKFEYANGGTLFLDEVGDMPLTLQAKLLRVLEDGQVYRIGGNEAIRVNVRILSATHRDLEALVAKGAFRQDLYYRLKVVTIKLPPLRERREDITLLAHHFMKEMAQRHGKQVTGIAAEVRRVLTAYDWPGNVRELRNVLDSMVVHDRDGILGMDDLPEGELLWRAQGPSRTTSAEASLIGKPLEEVERFYIHQALELTQGNREEAARMLGIGERTLYRKIKQWGLNVRKRGPKSEPHSAPNSSP
ncbi:MAG: sigma-54 dependent transcriptional regulator [Gemmatales bacterium]|nr:sigma-54 dependent transcriptional regulator [Gemmatales bacterium]MCS7161007.1 sigma-54 dependent transcriptional regulator [Gemmatales bacterium]MDW8221667.1 sigma-54 dependent transcriptional regulator [Gemmatales bacterium]